MLSLMPGRRTAKWRRWIDGQIKAEILTMHLHRATWQRAQAIIAGNPGLPDSYWWEFMFDTYAVSQAVAIRRQCEIGSDVASLAKLVKEVGDDASSVTLEYWHGLWGDSRAESAQRVWEEHFAGGVGDHLDPAIAADDFEALRRTSVRVTHYVDRHVAHSDTRQLPASELPTMAELHDAVEMIGELFQKYAKLLTVTSRPRLVPLLIEDWEAVFGVQPR